MDILENNYWAIGVVQKQNPKSLICKHHSTIEKTSVHDYQNATTIAVQYTNLSHRYTIILYVRSTTYGYTKLH
jgi:hypothetical protein